MARSKPADIVKSINAMVDRSDSLCSEIKAKWVENYDMFTNGTVDKDKDEWQVKLTTGKIERAVRTAQGRLVSKIVQGNEYYALNPKTPNIPEAAEANAIIKKILDYYLTASKFKRHASNFFTSALVSTGALYVGYKSRLIRNPKHVIEQTEKDRLEIERKIAGNLTNPSTYDDSPGEDKLRESVLKAVDELQGEMDGTGAADSYEEPKYIRVGALDFIDINHEKIYWEPSIQYMEDSPWIAFDLEVNRYELEHQAQLGFLSKAKVKSIPDASSTKDNSDMSRLRYKRLSPANSSTSRDLVKLRYFFGDLVVDGKVKYENYHCIVANDSVLLKEGDHPFWEPPGHKTPVVISSVRQIPYRPTGAGITDNAVPLQKLLDSNYELQCDKMRYAMTGFHIINQNNLVDSTQLDNGIHPGMIVKFRSGAPKDNFQTVSLSDNIESQVQPVNTMISETIDGILGINEVYAGGGNPFSRTSAAETQSRIDAGQVAVNTIALDLETNFMIPALEKCLARVLQFGLLEVDRNPELRNLLTEEEKVVLEQLQGVSERFDILNQWYNFEVKGFSDQSNRNEAAMRDNEFLNIINSNGIAAQFVDVPQFMKRYFHNRGMDKPNELLLLKETPAQKAIAEHAVLLAGSLVIPGENDDDQLHLNLHSSLLQSPYSTPALQQHAQMHQQRLMIKQQMMAAQQPQPPKE